MGLPYDYSSTVLLAAKSSAIGKVVKIAAGSILELADVLPLCVSSSWIVCFFFVILMSLFYHCPTWFSLDTLI